LPVPLVKPELQLCIMTTIMAEFLHRFLAL
jgi:hypothetical protein